MKVLITGSNGLLGQKIVALCLDKKIDFIATSSGENRNINCPDSYYTQMNIIEYSKVKEVVQDSKPTHLIHTAAITNVDYCELNSEECDKVNVKASQFLFDVCENNNIHFQFLSTDFVFDGLKGNYSEGDKTFPLSVYGKSKDQVEKTLIQSSYKNWSIIRTIIVYGKGVGLSRSNLILWAREALQNENQLSIVDDQYRAPTYADDLAWACVEVLKRSKTGLFHISGPKTYSIYEIVKIIANHYNLDFKKVKRISSDSLNQPANRPKKTGFNLTKSKIELNYSPKELKESLDLM